MAVPPAPPRADDRTPLLAVADDADEPKKPTPLPRVQICILLLTCLIEPIASQCIYPFINQLVGELDITGGDETKVGYYAGMIESLFFVTQALTVFQWSRASDRVGRKPVLLIGLFGFSISMFSFGLSRTFTGLVLSRCITGALNGNIGVVKSMLGELTDSTNIAQGFALLPMSWSVGMTLGPVIGGILARPRDNFPALFTSPFWARFPYFLPCGVTAGLALLAFVTILLSLKETLPRGVTPEKRDRSVDAEAGGPEINYAAINEQQPLRSPLSDEPMPLWKLLNGRRVLRITNYGVLAVFEIALWSLSPLFYATAIEHGGLGLTPLQIGFWMACFGLFNGFFQAFFFASLVDRLGAKRLYQVGHACFIPLFILFPVINWVAQLWGITWLVWAGLSCQLVLTIIMDMAFSSIIIYITAAAPNRRCLGALHGVAQTTASVARAVSPATASSLFAYSIHSNFMGGYGVYIVLVLATIATMPLGAMLPDDVAERC